MFCCENCGKNFPSKQSLAAHISHCQKQKYECPICHKLIQVRSVGRHQKAHEKYNTCLNCGRTLTDFKKFCCHSCAASYNNKQRKQVRYCEICGKELTYRQKKYCSLECSAAKNREKNRDEFLKGNAVANKTIRRQLIIDRGNKCSICSTSTWCGKELVLIVDHINGNPEDNRPDNLRLLCPNCDSQTDTYKGRNVGNGRYKRRIRYALGKSY